MLFTKIHVKKKREAYTHKAQSTYINDWGLPLQSHLQMVFLHLQQNGPRFRSERHWNGDSNLLQRLTPTVVLHIQAIASIGSCLHYKYKELLVYKFSVQMRLKLLKEIHVHESSRRVQENITKSKNTAVGTSREVSKNHWLPQDIHLIPYRKV